MMTVDILVPQEYEIFWKYINYNRFIRSPVLRHDAGQGMKIGIRAPWIKKNKIQI
jgi:hypothetical protein